jgi:hypothetical protein
MSTQRNEYQKALAYWLNTLNFTHAATITLSDDCQTVQRAAALSSYVIKKFNKLIYGKAGAKGKANISSICVIEDGYGRKRTHVHCALGNFKSTMTELQVRTAFKKAIQLASTRGAAEILDFAPCRDKQEWISYMTKELSARKSERILIQHMSAGTTVPPPITIEPRHAKRQ